VCLGPRRAYVSTVRLLQAHCIAAHLLRKIALLGAVDRQLAALFKPKEQTARVFH
jgi:hypothetical protein